MKSPEVYFVSGVCGAGKSTVMKELKDILPSIFFDVRDFDERGVPDGGGLEWHNNETRYWLDVALENAKKGKSTVICGFAEPERFSKVHTSNDLPARLLLLHASSDELRKRLYGRYPTPESVQEINRASGVALDQFVENNVSYAPTLKSIFGQTNLPIIETDSKTPAEVAKEVAKRLEMDIHNEK